MGEAVACNKETGRAWEEPDVDKVEDCNIVAEIE